MYDCYVAIKAGKIYVDNFLLPRCRLEYTKT